MKLSMSNNGFFILHSYQSPNQDSGISDFMKKCLLTKHSINVYQILSFLPLFNCWIRVSIFSICSVSFLIFSRSCVFSNMNFRYRFKFSMTRSSVSSCTSSVCCSITSTDVDIFCCRTPRSYARKQRSRKQTMRRKLCVPYHLRSPTMPYILEALHMIQSSQIFTNNFFQFGTRYM